MEHLPAMLGAMLRRRGIDGHAADRVLHDRCRLSAVAIGVTAAVASRAGSMMMVLMLVAHVVLSRRCFCRRHMGCLKFIPRGGILQSWLMQGKNQS